MSKRHTHVSTLKFFERVLELPTGGLFVVWVVIILGFALAFFLLSSTGDGSNGVNMLSNQSMWHKIGDAVYFSVITATTLGYGDIIPLGFSRALAATESILGFFILAAVISKLVSRKQEIALYNVHKLAFQDAFFKTREGFYILRRDCDAIGAYAQEHKTLGEKYWSNFLIVCQKGQTLFEGILDFYDASGIYTVDKRREQLLLDGVYRTLLRVQSLLKTLEAAKVRWKNHAECAQELRAFVSFAEATLRRWQSKSFNNNSAWFKKVREASHVLSKQVKA